MRSRAHQRPAVEDDRFFISASKLTSLTVKPTGCNRFTSLAAFYHIFFCIKLGFPIMDKRDMF